MLTRGRAGLVLVALMLALTACSGSADVPDEPTSELDAYLNEIGGDVDEASAVPDPNLIVEQELIAACMANAGFEYHPDLGNRSYTSPAPMGLTTEHAREFGYGHTTEAFGPGEPPERWRLDSMTDPGMEWNDNYLRTLSADAQAAYLVALHGPEPEDSDDLPPLAEQGCWGRAQSEVV